MDDIDRELIEMLQEPTARQVQRKLFKHEDMLTSIGRAIEPEVNALLSDLARKIPTNDDHVQRSLGDAAWHGIGILKDGKHIPLDEFYAPPPDDTMEATDG